MRAPRALAYSWIQYVVSIAIALAAAAPLHAQITAADDAYSTQPSLPMTVPAAAGVLVNDSGGNRASYSAALVTNVASGALLFGADGGFFYLPNIGFTGNDSFTYQVSDGTSQSNVATVSITVSGIPNAPPTAAGDTYTGGEDTQLDVAAATGVLANDTDPEGGALTAVLAASTSEGTLTLNADGSFRYTPRAGYVGNDQFSYRARDSGGALSDTATVAIAVNNTNDAPVAGADSYNTNEGQTLNVNANNGVLGNDTDPDGDALTAVLVGAASSGTVMLNANGAFSFTPAAGFNGTATFTYQAADAALRSATTTVTITIAAVNDPPTAAADSYTATEDATLTVGAAEGVLANDTDPDSTALTAVLVRNVTNGTLALQPNGSFTYAPAGNFSGTTTFTYQARDGAASSATTTVTITVTAVNDPPFISNAPATTATEGVTYRYTMAASDPDGNALQITASTLPGWLRFTPPATIQGTPAQADAGSHEVAMEVSDGIAAAVVQRFQIAVQAVDNAPQVTAIADQTATEGAAFDFDLSPSVTDADTPAGGITYSVIDGLPPGVTLASNGRLSGTPTLGASVGQYTVRFNVADATSRVPGSVRVMVIAAGRIDLAVTLTAAPTPVALDALATWTIAIANRAANVAAPGVALDVLFVGDVPFRFDAPTTAGCTATPTGNQTALACTLGALAGGATTTITLTGRGSFAGDVFAHAKVSSTGGVAIDEVPGNDQTTASLSIAQRIASSAEQRIVGVGARAIAAADFDGDGFDDLVAATGSARGVVLIPNIIDPSNSVRRMFAATPQSLGGEALGTDIAVADLDRDGDLDVVVASAAGAPDRAFFNGGAQFTTAALGAATVDSRAVAAGDINGDGFVDIVFANPGGSSVLINNGAAGFTAGTAVGAQDARDVLLVDLLGDTLPELVIVNGDGNAAVYGNAGGVFAPPRELPTGPASSAASADFNGDGRTDLAIGRATAARPGIPSTLVLLNETAQFFNSDELGAATTNRLVVRDLDLDGRIDVLASSPAGQRMFTNAGAANGTFTLHPLQLATPGARDAAAGRFSNDDRVDLVVAGDDITVFVNDGKGNFGSGDSTPPTLTLRGEPTVNITIDAPFTDPGVTATDAVDGDLTTRVIAAGAVNTALLGSYTVTYTVTDLSGNAATPVTRTVNVQAQAGAEEGGGGGAVGGELLLALLLALYLARRQQLHGNSLTRRATNPRA
jgi:VCBS repeat-containing protein